MSEEVLRINDLWVEVGGMIVVKGVSLTIRCGETHILFGPNGSGKSTLLRAIMGFSAYKIIHGDIYFKGRRINDLSLEERARMGIGISFQEAPPVTGVKLRHLLQTLKRNGDDIEKLAEELKMTDHLDRDINVGFSGGEKKRSEILQLMVQNPDIVLLDEPESGVDIENIELLGKYIDKLLEKDIPHNEMLDNGRRKCGLIITHTGHILDYVPADKAYVMVMGKLVCAGNPTEVLHQIRENGFGKCDECLVKELVGDESALTNAG